MELLFAFILGFVLGFGLIVNSLNQAARELTKAQWRDLQNQVEHTE
jgi:hypothetical protein